MVCWPNNQLNINRLMNVYEHNIPETTVRARLGTLCEESPIMFVRTTLAKVSLDERPLHRSYNASKTRFENTPRKLQGYVVWPTKLTLLADNIRSNGVMRIPSDTHGVLFVNNKSSFIQET